MLCGNDGNSNFSWLFLDTAFVPTDVVEGYSICKPTLYVPVSEHILHILTIHENFHFIFQQSIFQVFPHVEGIFSNLLRGELML